MSDNPFASPYPLTPGQPVESPGYPQKPMTPTWVNVICIITLVLGVLGLFSVFMTVGGIFVNRAMQAKLEVDDSEIAQAQTRLYRETNKHLIPNLILQVANLFITASLIIGSIMTLTRKAAGPGLLRNVFLIAILFNVLRSIYSLYVQIQMKEVMVSSMMAGNPPKPEMVMQIMEVGYYVGLIVGVVVALALIGFYFFSYRYFGGEPAKKYFASFG